MKYLKLKSIILTLSYFIIISLCDPDHIEYDMYPNNGAIPEKELPNEPVYDSQEPREYEPEWKYTVKTVISVAAIVQVIILTVYILVSKVCCLHIKAVPFMDGYPVKPWINDHLNMAERRYLSNKDDAYPNNDDDFDTDDAEQIEI